MSLYENESLINLFVLVLRPLRRRLSFLLIGPLKKTKKRRNFMYASHFSFTGFGVLMVTTFVIIFLC